MFNFGGGMLTGEEIRKQVKKGNIDITPYDPSCINPNSYNLKLHPQLLIYARGNVEERQNSIKQKYPNLTQIHSKYKGPEDSDIGFINPADAVISPKDNFENVEELSEASRGILEPDTITEIEIKDAIPVEYSFKDTIDDIKYQLTSKTESEINKEKRFREFVDNYQQDMINQLYSIPNINSYLLEPLDMHKRNPTMEIVIPKEGYVLQPGVLYIGRTVETTFSDKFIPMINGRSSIGRLGIDIHICAGFGDIGFHGSWTLEIRVVEPVRIYPDSEIAQVCFFKPYGKVKNLYKGRYQYQVHATASKSDLPKIIY